MGLARAPSRSSRRSHRSNLALALVPSLSSSTRTPSPGAVSVSSPGTSASPTIAAVPPQPETGGGRCRSVFVHPDLCRALARHNAQRSKLYMEGYLSRRDDLAADGRPLRAEDPRKAWSLCFVQLAGTVLSIWPVRALQAAAQDGTQVPPTYMDITDGVVDYVGELGEDVASVPNSKGSYENVFALCTAGGNRSYWCVEGQVGRTLVRAWINALRLASWEKMRLEEMYTAALFRAHRFPPTGDKRDKSIRRLSFLSAYNSPLRLTMAPSIDPLNEDSPPDPGNASDFDPNVVRSPLTRGRLEGSVRARFMGSTQWKQFYLVLAASPEDVRDLNARRWYTKFGSAGSRSSLLSIHASSEFVPFYDPFLGTSPPQGVHPTQGVAYFYDSRHAYQSGARPCASIIYAAHAYAVYPARDDLVRDSNLFKIEGIISPPYLSRTAAMGRTRTAGWALIMPESESRGGSKEMLQWILATWDAFHLSGRPHTLLFDPREERSPFFAYPAGPDRDRLFLDREQAEFLEMDCDFLSQRYNFHSIMVLRMQGKDTPLLPPLPSLNTTATSFLSARKGMIIKAATQSKKDENHKAVTHASARQSSQRTYQERQFAEQQQQRYLLEGPLAAITSGLDNVRLDHSASGEGNTHASLSDPSHPLLSPQSEPYSPTAYPLTPSLSQLDQPATFPPPDTLSLPCPVTMHSVPSIAAVGSVQGMSLTGQNLPDGSGQSASAALAPAGSFDASTSPVGSGSELHPLIAVPEAAPFSSIDPQGGYSPLPSTPLVITNLSLEEQTSMSSHGQNRTFSTANARYDACQPLSRHALSPLQAALEPGYHLSPKRSVASPSPLIAGPTEDDSSQAVTAPSSSLLSASYCAPEPSGLPAQPISPTSPISPQSQQSAVEKAGRRVSPCKPADLVPNATPTSTLLPPPGPAENTAYAAKPAQLGLPAEHEPHSHLRVTPSSSQLEAGTAHLSNPITGDSESVSPMMGFPPHQYVSWPGMPLSMPMPLPVSMSMSMPGMPMMPNMPLMPAMAGMGVPPMGSYPMNMQQIHAMQAAQAAYAQAMALPTTQSFSDTSRSGRETPSYAHLAVQTGAPVPNRDSDE